jgi:transcriptional regulator with XRE-family HTH domain
MTQQALAQEVEMKQSRISAMERPGTRFNIETLVRLASIFQVGLVVKFVSFSEMLKWENSFSQDEFNVQRIDSDAEFLGISEGPSTPHDLGREVVAELLSGTFSRASDSSIGQLWKYVKGEGQQPRTTLDAMIGAQQTGGLPHAAFSGSPS